MLQNLIAGFGDALQPFNLLLTIAGTALGIIIGALPGLSSPMAIVVLLPVTYGMEPLPALLLMIGIYVGTKLGGSYSAILLRTPGTPAGACTALDGYPLAQQGKAGHALGYATVGSSVGGLIGWAVAVSCVPLIATVALNAGPADIALIGTAGLVMVCAFVRGSLVKGFLGVLFGILIGTVGIDPEDGVMRYTFGSLELSSGIPFAAALVGIFGIAVVLSDIILIGDRSHIVDKVMRLAMPKARDIAKRWQAIAIGAGYGVGVGAVPGVGADGSTWLSYATVRNRSKTPENFGKGEPDGILAPESSNNATTGGTMIPLLTLGIPGDGSTAVMLGALLLHGVTPGVTMMRDNGDIVWGILAGLLIANIAMFFLGWKAIRYFIFVLQQDRSWLFPFILILATIGAFATSNTVFPIWVALAFGVIGFLLEQRGFPVVTIVLGIILGPVIEINLRLAMSLSNGDWGTFVATWPRIFLISVVLLLIAMEIRQSFKHSKSISDASACSAHS
ncbi:tripartite tricarboxylate transporter permease [Aurantimonas sp. DM33-3]|uniref:tripartite tricarboxylate transporter permease n=1 Tax=Aurantimonas sp. DM33-3 TaxID=2766955 RepID=UPI00165213E0|nr:tripartite tricarboxylate transporter permease [Aurantimonas sp. DM33-3]MBC6718857.1 tripartite tricarboxylate transporter permease [Aurantimonas sp. DM33-3]